MILKLLFIILKITSVNWIMGHSIQPTQKKCFSLISSNLQDYFSPEHPTGHLSPTYRLMKLMGTSGKRRESRERDRCEGFVSYWGSRLQSWQCECRPLLALPIDRPDKDGNWQLKAAAAAALSHGRCDITPQTGVDTPHRTTCGSSTRRNGRDLRLRSINKTSTSCTRFSY